MQFSDEDSDGSTGKARGKKTDDSEDLSQNMKLAMGVAFLLFFFVTDSFTSQWQTALYKKHPNVSQTQMMLGGNLLGLLITSGSMFFNWGKITKSMGVAYENPEILGRIVALGFVS